MNLLRIKFTLLWILLASVNVTAQDTHYWNLQYGTSSALLGGAVIGSVSDIAATYYNPAAPALFPRSEILLSGKAYQYSSLKLNNDKGAGSDLESSSIEAAPSIFAGSFTFDWLGDHSLSYSILTRQYMGFGIEGRRNGISEGNPNELSAGELIANQELSDLWLGLTWAKKITPNISIGVSPYLSIRDQTTRKTVYEEIMNQSKNVSSEIITQHFEYRVISFVAKMGIGAKFAPFTLGLTLTTPYLTLTGHGSSLVNLTSSGSGIDNQSVYIVNDQLDVPATYHAPLSVGFGFGYRIGKHRLHFSAEWFDKVSKYNLLETEDFIGQSDGETYPNDVNTEAKSVLNFGIGCEFYIRENFWLIASFITDYSTSISDTRTNLGVSTWDIFHISGGALVSIWRSEINLGVTYGFGSAKVLGPINLPEGETQGNLADLLQNSDIEYSRIKLLIGFSFALN